MAIAPPEDALFGGPLDLEPGDAAVQDALARAPWWMLSTALHALVLIVTMLVAWDQVEEERTVEFTALLADEEEEVVEPEDDWEETRQLDPNAEPTEDPVHNPDAIVDTRNETNDDHESEQAMGDSLNALSNFNAKGPSTNSAIGMAAGAAGAWGGRLGGKADRVTKGGGEGTQSAVARGLRWLADHQDPATGAWDSDDFQSQCVKNTCSQRGGAWCDVGQTGLALLAFLGAGHTPVHEGPYREHVKKALRYLVGQQDGEGCFGSRSGHFLYNHAIAALAVTEAAGMTGKPTLRESAQRSIDFLVAAQNPGFGWRYRVQPGENDTSVTGWAVMALKSARVAELRVPPGAFEGAKSWLDSVTDNQYYRTGYMQSGDLGARPADLVGQFAAAESCTAISIMSRLFMGADRSDPLVRGQGDLLSQCLPVWDVDGGPGGASRIDYYYWYYGTLAMFQLGGDHWKTWNHAMKNAIVKHQRTDGDERGSWDAIGAWGREGGRVYSTAINVLSLEIYYRYERVFR